MAAALALLSSLLWGSADFLGGSTSRRLRPAVVVGASQAVALVAIGAVLLATGAWRGSAAAVPWGIAAGLTGFCGLLAFYQALADGTMGVVSPIAATGVVVPVAAGLLRGERPATVQLVGIAIAVCGIVLASGPELAGRAGARPVVLAAVAACAFGVALLLITEGSRTSALTTMATMRVSSVTVVLLVAAATRTAGGLHVRDLPTITAIGLADLSANVVFGFASTRGLVSLVAVLGSLYPVVTVLLARALHGERLGGLQNAGVAAALTGVALIAAR